MVKIEYLFPEICNLYGDTFNVKYLANSLKDSKVFETALTETPKFVSENIDFIYIGSMSESSQELVINKLKPYVDKIKEFISNSKIILATGNALEVFGKYIENEDNSKIEGLGITELYAKRDMMHRYNTLYLGKLKDSDIKITGFKATFSFSYGDNSKDYAFKSIKGCGINKDSTFEGIKMNNFIGTYLIGPLLVINPYFTKYLINLLGEKENSLQFEKEAIECYTQRLSEFESESTNYLQ